MVVLLSVGWKTFDGKFAELEPAFSNLLCQHEVVFVNLLAIFGNLVSEISSFTKSAFDCQGVLVLSFGSCFQAAMLADDSVVEGVVKCEHSVFVCCCSSWSCWVLIAVRISCGWHMTAKPAGSLAILL